MTLQVVTYTLCEDGEAQEFISHKIVEVLDSAKFKFPETNRFYWKIVALVEIDDA